MPALYHRFDGYEQLKPVLDGSDEDVLVNLGKPALVRIPGTEPRPRARLVSCLLHGNEDSGYRAVLEVLREGARYPFDLWVLIGNVRAAVTGGWYAHRFLEGQEDFNRVWDWREPTTKMRRCADAMLDELRLVDLEAGVDLHNNTGSNPHFSVLPQLSADGLELASLFSDTVLRWGMRLHTLMEALSPRCPAVAVECGLPRHAENLQWASSAVRRFLARESFEARTPPAVTLFEQCYRVVVRPEVPFAFGGVLSEELDLVVHTGLDHYNFGMLLAGTELGHVFQGAGMPVLATDMRGRETTDRFFEIHDGALRTTEDITPVMLTTTVQQIRRDCFFYIARRRA